MGVAIQPLGPPSIARSGKAVAPPRGRKAWAELAPVLGVRAMALPDRAHDNAALALARQSEQRADRCGDLRQVAWSLAVTGRVHLLRGELAAAAEALDAEVDNPALNRAGMRAR